MERRRTTLLATAFGVAALMMMLALAPAGALEVDEEGITNDFRIEDCSFSSRGRTAFWSLEPGDRFVLEGEEDGEEIVVEETILDEEEILVFTTERGKTMTVRARVVLVTETVDGELAERTRDYYARCRETNDVYYFGEFVENYEDGELVDNEGSWRAGEDGALPGVIMPGTFFLGATYHQEIAPESALDFGVNTDLGFMADVGFGTFDDCIEVTEGDLLEPEDESVKVYCPGIGIVLDEELELTEHEMAAPPAPPTKDWLMTSDLGGGGFRAQVRISAGDSVLMGAQEMVCDSETLCVSGAVPGRVEALVRVPGPKPNGYLWPTIAKLSTSQVEVWIEQLSTGQINYYRVDGSSPGSSDLPGFFDREGFLP